MDHFILHAVLSAANNAGTGLHDDQEKKAKGSETVPAGCTGSIYTGFSVSFSDLSDPIQRSSNLRAFHIRKNLTPDDKIIEL